MFYLRGDINFDIKLWVYIGTKRKKKEKKFDRWYRYTQLGISLEIPLQAFSTQSKDRDIR